MAKPEITNRIKKCMVSIFGIEEDAINDDASMDNIEAWDSIRHINLIIALEQEFGITFPDEEVALLTSAQLLGMAVYDAFEGRI
jgi:acyl carrier protein